MVRVHQAAGARHDAVPVGVGIVGKGDVETVAHRDQARHRERRGTIHPDFAIPVRRHETEGRIDGVVHDRRIDSVMFDQRLPVMNGGAAERIDADFHARRFDQRHVDGIAEIGDIGTDVVVQMRRGGLAGALVRKPRNALHVGLHIGVGGLFDLARHVGVGRTAMRRIVFVAAILGRIVRRRDDDAIGKPAGSALVVAQDRMRDDRRRRVAAALVDHDVDAVGGKHFHRAGQRRLGERMGIDADEQRARQVRFRGGGRRSPASSPGYGFR